MSDPEPPVHQEGALFVVRHPLGWAEHAELVGLLDQLGVELDLVDLRERVRRELLTQVRERGVSAILSTVLVEETLVAKGESRNAYTNLIAGMVSSLMPAHTLRLADPYLLKHNEQEPMELANMTIDAISPALDCVHTVALYFHPKYYRSVMREAILDTLAQRGYGGEVTFHKCDDVHDRFLVIDDRRGLVMGTSMNGVSKQYFLVDFLKGKDAVDIATVLRRYEADIKQP